MKADVDDVNKALNNIYQELDNKCCLEDVSQELLKINESYQHMLNEVNTLYNNLNIHNQKDNNLEIKTLRSNYKDISTPKDNNENLYKQTNDLKRKGKWQWKSGALKSGLAIPWEVQSKCSFDKNTFTWEAGKTFIIIEQNGVYKLNFILTKKAHFSKESNIKCDLNEVSIQILLDGEIINTLESNTINHNVGYNENYNNDNKNKISHINNNSDGSNIKNFYNVNSNRSKMNESLKSLTLRSNNEERSSINNNQNYYVNSIKSPSNFVFSGSNTTVDFISFNEIIYISKSKSKVAICLLKEEPNFEGYLTIVNLND